MPMNEDTKRQTDMKNAATGAADVLRGLANSDRLLLMCQLSRGSKRSRAGSGGRYFSANPVSAAWCHASLKAGRDPTGRENGILPY